MLAAQNRTAFVDVLRVFCSTTDPPGENGFVLDRQVSRWIRQRLLNVGTDLAQARPQAAEWRTVRPQLYSARNTVVAHPTEAHRALKCSKLSVCKLRIMYVRIIPLHNVPETWFTPSLLA